MQESNDISAEPEREGSHEVDPMAQMLESPLSVQVVERPPYIVAQWIGTGDDTSLEVARKAVAELSGRLSERLVLELGRFTEVADSLVLALASLVAECQRQGRDICLVRCSDELYARLRQAGVAGGITHAGSLMAATQGMCDGSSSVMELHLSSSATHLYRLRQVMGVIAQRTGLSEEAEMHLRIAITEAAANAIAHGSPHGARNHVRVSFNLDPGALIVDVADQGPGFDPDSIPVPDVDGVDQRGYGLMLIRRSVDRVEFFRDESGMLVRMTRWLDPAPDEEE